MLNATFGATSMAAVTEDEIDVLKKYYCFSDFASFVLYPALAFQWLQCIFCALFGIYIIYTHYIRSNTLVLNLRIASSVCSIFWILSCILWMLNYHSVFDCNENWIIYFQLTEAMASSSMLLAYVALDVCFAIRLITAFQDTLWAISRRASWYLYGMITIALLCGIAGLICFFIGTYLRSFAFTFFALGLLIFAVSSIIILFLVISKTYQFLIFSKENDFDGKYYHKVSSKSARQTRSRSQSQTMQPQTQNQGTNNVIGPCEEELPSQIDIDMSAISRSGMDTKDEISLNVMSPNINNDDSCVSKMENHCSNEKNIIKPQKWKMKNKNRMNQHLLELIIRLIIIFGFSLFSTFIEFCLFGYLGILWGNDDYNGIRRANIFLRIIYLNEAIISSLCLSLQNKNARSLYKFLCNSCHKTVEKCCLKCTHML